MLAVIGQLPEIPRYKRYNPPYLNNAFSLLFFRLTDNIYKAVPAAADKILSPSLTLIIFVFSYNLFACGANVFPLNLKFSI